MGEFDAASRFSLVEVAGMAPGVDFLTKSPNGPFVDTGRDVQFAETGRVYLSLDTLREMAEGAGLFEPLRAELLEAQHVGYQLGYADATKENVGGRIDDLSTQLGVLADRLARTPVVARDEDALGRDDSEPLVLVTDGGDSSRRAARAHKDDGAAGTASRQGNRASRNKRPAGFPAGAGDGNPFRI